MTHVSVGVFFFGLHSTIYLILVDEGGSLDTQVYLSGTGTGGHTGTVSLSGSQMVWITHKDGITSIDVDRPQ